MEQTFGRDNSMLIRKQPRIPRLFKVWWVHALIIEVTATGDESRDLHGKTRVL